MLNITENIYRMLENYDKYGFNNKLWIGWIEHLKMRKRDRNGLKTGQLQKCLSVPSWEKYE